MSAKERIYGELVMQKPPAAGHSGRLGDLPGPGEYAPSDSLLRRKVHVADFGRLWGFSSEGAKATAWREMKVRFRAQRADGPK
jgi:hypothetical protein